MVHQGMFARARLRRVLLAVGTGVTIWRAALAVPYFLEWRRWRQLDPSGADLYGLNARLELALAAAVAAATIGAWRLLRDVASR